MVENLKSSSLLRDADECEEREVDPKFRKERVWVEVEERHNGKPRKPVVNASRNEDASQDGPAVIRTRQGPQVKKNVPKRKPQDKGADGDEFDRERVYLVAHDPGLKGAMLPSAN